MSAGDLTGVLSTHLSVETNAKTHNFWSFKKFIDRLACTAEEYGITVSIKSEAWTSQECPDCGSTDLTTRQQHILTCSCGFQGHADLTASKTLPERQIKNSVRLMAQPVRFEWNDHEWSESPRSDRPKEQRTDRSTIHADRNIASGVSS